MLIIKLACIFSVVMHCYVTKWPKSFIILCYEKVQSIWLCMYVMKNVVVQSAASVFVCLEFIVGGISGILLFGVCVSVCVCVYIDIYNHWLAWIWVEGRFSQTNCYIEVNLSVLQVLGSIYCFSKSVHVITMRADYPNKLQNGVEGRRFP